MMQFTETPPLPCLHQIVTTTPSAATSTSTTPTPPPPPINLQIMNKINQTTNRTRPWPGSFPTSTSTSKLTNFGDANCMEQLLVHCATAIQTNDATLAQQILWVLNNIAPPDGDSNQRLTSAFLRALISRAARSGSLKLLAAMNAANQLQANNTTNLAIHTHKFSVIELAGFIDLTPWHRFGFTAANAAILEAVEGFSVVHIVDLSLTHCMQIPTLLDAIASRQDGLTPPPLLKLTVAGTTEDVPPMLDLSYDELGSKLVNFARSRNIILEFRVIPSSYTDGFANLIEQLRVQNLVYPESGHEALVINCHMMLHYIPEETFQNYELLCTSSSTSSTSLRSMFLKAIRGLDPTVVILVDEDADLTSNDLVARLRSAFNYLWIPYDTVDTFLPRGSKQRQWYEADVCWKIENVIAYEGFQRVERLEPKCRWVQRMRGAGFRSVSFGEEAVNEVKAMLDDHAAGWGLKREEEDLVLTWKGHNVVFATAWMTTAA